MATISLPKSPTFLGNFCKGVKIFYFYSEIIFGQLLKTFGYFLLVTLEATALPTAVAQLLHRRCKRTSVNQISTEIE